MALWVHGMRVPKRPFVFFYSKIQNFTVASKRSFVFIAAYEILQLYSNGHPFFKEKYKILKTVPKQPFFPRSFVLLLQNTNILKLYPNGYSFFDHKIQNLKLHSNEHLFFDYKQWKWNLINHFLEKNKENY